jgi:hypothetical protein
MTLTDPISPDLKRHLRTLKLGQLMATLPERLTLARQNNLPHADFLELLLSDEVTRRENGSAARRAHAAGLDPQMRTDTWDPTAAVRYDQQLWNELVTLRFAEAAPAPSSWDPSESARHTWPPPSATSPSAAASPST